MKWARRATFAAFAVFWTLHACQCICCFVSFEAIFDDRPILQVDHALHLYHGSLGSRFLKEGGATWGYDPFFMACYPKTPFHDPSAALSDFSQFFAGGGYHVAAYKIGLFVTLLTGPLLVYFGARGCGMASPAALLGTVLAFCFFWLDYPKILLDSGLYAFLWASCWLIAILGLSVRWQLTPGLRSWLVLAGGTSVAFLIHPTMTVMAVTPLIGWFALSFRRRSVEVSIEKANGWNWRLATIAAGGIAVVVNLFWIVPMIRFWKWRGPQFNFMTAPDNDPLFFAWFYLSRTCARVMVALGKARAGAADAVEADHYFLAALVVFGFIGVARWIWTRRSECWTSIGLTAVWLFALTFFGSLIAALRGLEPIRYQVPLHLILSLPLADLIFTAIAWPFRSQAWPTVFVSSIAVAIFAAVVFPFSLRPEFADAVVRRVMPCGLTSEMTGLCDWIVKHTDDSARILFEDQLRLREATIPESTHWTPLLPILTGRQFIGGQYQCAPLLHQYAAFGDFELARKPIDQYSAAQLSATLQQYNVGWVICWSPKSRAVFDWYDGVEKLTELPRYATKGRKPTEENYFIYRVKQPGSFFAQGSGRVVSVAPNRLEFADLQPQDGQVVLRYHWFEALQADPPLPLVRVPSGSDPVGFIGIKTDKKIERLVIQTRY